MTQYRLSCLHCDRQRSASDPLVLSVLQVFDGLPLTPTVLAPVRMNLSTEECSCCSSCPCGKPFAPRTPAVQTVEPPMIIAPTSASPMPTGVQDRALSWRDSRNCAQFHPDRWSGRRSHLPLSSRCAVPVLTPESSTCAVRINLAKVQLEFTCQKQFCQAKIIASTLYGATFARFPKPIAQVEKVGPGRTVNL